MFPRLITVLAIGLIALAALVVSLKGWVAAELDSPMNLPPEGMVLEVPAGDSLSQLSRKLAAREVIDSPYPVLLHLRFRDTPPIMAGEYRLQAGDSVMTLIDKLVSGDVIRYRVTFPEGRTLRQWIGIINRHPKFSSRPPLDMAAVNARFTAPAGDHLEGWFFPDTYSFTAAGSPLGVLEHAHEKMQEVLAEEWKNRRRGLPLESAYEALILASIVEKETGLPRERPAIAGVFIRRLEKGMKLQTDPTVIYGLGEEFDGNLTRDHLREKNPYNTYVISGLPPTPVANPGRESIHAVLHPEEGTALFFVARGDGSHQFSNTLAEHIRAVRRYQLQRVEDYRSTPE